MIARLLSVESPEEPTEIVIHVNMLKEGWDVTNLYTIVPLRAANARILIEQSIGRGLRLPYGKRTRVTAVDRLNIIAHDKFQEIVDEANRPDSMIRLQQVILEPEKDLQRTVTVVAQASVLNQIGAQTQEAFASGSSTTPVIIGADGNADGLIQERAAAPVFATEVERKIAQTAYDVIRKYEHLPSSSHLLRSEVATKILEQVEAEIAPSQISFPDLTDKPSVAEIVVRTAELVIQRTIDIPHILVVPHGEVTRGFHPFRLDASAINYQPIEHDILIQALRTGERETLGAQDEAEEEERLENYLVHALADFDDVSYDEHADMLYDLAGQMVEHLKDYLPDETAVRNVLKHYRRPLADFIHAQMLSHQWEKVQRYDVEVRKGFTELKECAFTASADEPIRDFRLSVEDKGRIGQIVFGGFERCLYPVQKFQSDPERRLAVILDREVEKWFKPVLGQFQIFWKDGHEQREYQPDFVAETSDAIYLIEVKRRGEIESQEVQAKKDAAVNWCQHATQHALSYGGKPWRYLLIPHDSIADNMTLDWMASQFLINRLT